MSLVPLKPCNTYADVMERARSVQALRNAMVSPRAVTALASALPALIFRPVETPRPAPPPPRRPAAPTPKMAKPPKKPPPPDICLIEGIYPNIKRVPIAVVIQATCRYFDLHEIELLSRQQRSSLVFPRHICIYIAYKTTVMSGMEIANKIGGRDHSTAIHGRQRIEALLENKCPWTMEVVDKLLGDIRAAFPNAYGPPDRVRFNPPPTEEYPNTSRYYSADEIAHLTRLVAEGATDRAIARTLGRRPDAIWRKRKQLGLMHQKREGA